MQGNTLGFATEAERHEWRQTVIDDYCADEQIRRAAYRTAELSKEPGEDIVASDLVAAERYLAVCLDNLSDWALSSISSERVACLWGRGALGAARYRVKKGVKRSS